MAQQLLTVEISANTEKLKKGLAESKVELKGFAKEADINVNSISSSFKGLDRQLAQTKLRFNEANANVLGLEKELKNLDSSLKSGSISQSNYNREKKEVITALESARQASQRYQSRITSLNATLQQGSNIGRTYGNEVKKLQGVHDSVSRGIRGSSAISVEFGRVLSDLPYGIQGVANNIQQLTNNIGYYSKNVRESLLEQGKQASTWNITKSILSSLISPMGLVTIGVSAITAGWVIYDKWTQKANKSTEETKDKFAELAKNLNLTSSVLYQASQASGAEVAQLRVLYGVANDTTKSTHERRKASEQLISKYPELFKKIGEEGIMLGKAKDAYDKLTTSILATARAQAAYGKIGEKASQQLALDETNDALREEIRLTKVAIAQNEAKAKSMRSSINQGTEDAVLIAQTSDALERSLGLNNKVDDIQKKITDNLLERAKLSEQINKLESVAVSNQSKILNPPDSKTKGKTQTDLIKEANDALASGQVNTLRGIDKELEKIDLKWDKILEKIEKISNTGLKNTLKEQAKLNRETEKTLAAIDAFAKSPAIKGLTGAMSGVSLSGGAPNVPSIQALLDSSAGQKASKTQKSKIDNELSRSITRSIVSGLGNAFRDLNQNIGNLGSNFYEVFSNTFQKLSGAVSNILGDVVGKSIGEEFTEKLKAGDSDLGVIGSKAGRAILLGAQMAGNILSSVTSPTSTAGQAIGSGLSGAVSGAVTGAALGGKTGGIWGAAIGGILGIATGIFSSKRAKKERELQEKQLREAEAQTALQKRIAQLTYTSSIIGQQTNLGTITSIDRNEFGDVISRIEGKDIILSIDRTKSMGV